MAIQSIQSFSLHPWMYACMEQGRVGANGLYFMFDHYQEEDFCQNFCIMSIFDSICDFYWLWGIFYCSTSTFTQAKDLTHTHTHTYNDYADTLHCATVWAHFSLLCVQGKKAFSHSDTLSLITSISNALYSLFSLIFFNFIFMFIFSHMSSSLFMRRSNDKTFMAY